MKRIFVVGLLAVTMLLGLVVSSAAAASSSLAHASSVPTSLSASGTPNVVGNTQGGSDADAVQQQSSNSSSSDSPTSSSSGGPSASSDCTPKGDACHAPVSVVQAFGR